MAEILLSIGAVPGTPNSGKVTLYPKADKLLYLKNDAGVETAIVASYSDELAQDAIGGILTDSATIDFTYNDATPSIVADVITNTSIQKIEVSKAGGAVIGTRKKINLIEGAGATITVTDNSGADRVDIEISAAAGSGLTHPQVLNRVTLRA